MLGIIRRHPRALILAVIIHAVFLIVLGISMNWQNDDPAKIAVVKARIVDQPRAEDPQKKKREAERRKNAEQERKAREAQARKKREAEQKKKREAEQNKQRQAEQKKQREAELKKKRAAEEKRKLALEKKRKAEEQKRLAAERAEKERQEKLRKEKEEKERKKREEEARRKEIERQRAEEEERLRQEEQKRREEELKRRLAEEDQRLAQEAAAQRNSLIDEFRFRIQQEIERQWNIPPGTRAGTACVLRIRLIPSGEVVSVEITESSGVAAFDRSVENAVRKASPLPLPPADLGLTDEFREVNLRFAPDLQG